MGEMALNSTFNGYVNVTELRKNVLFISKINFRQYIEKNVYI